MSACVIIVPSGMIETIFAVRPIFCMMFSGDAVSTLPPARIEISSGPRRTV